MSKFKGLSMKYRVMFIVGLVIVVCFMIVLGINYSIAKRLLSRDYRPDLIIPSPDGQHELVVCEWNYLQGGGADIYIRKPGQDKWYNSWMKKEVGFTSTDDGYQSFASGDYYVEWESDKVTIYYFGDYGIENVNDRSTWRGVVTYYLD